MALIFAIALIGFTLPKAYAETLTDYEQIFLEKYGMVCELNLNGGLTTETDDDYYLIAGAGVEAGEQALALDENFFASYRNEREVLMVAYNLKTASCSSLTLSSTSSQGKQTSVLPKCP